MARYQRNSAEEFISTNLTMLGNNAGTEAVGPPCGQIIHPSLFGRHSAFVLIHVRG
jgi:hypothetical protein